MTTCTAESGTCDECVAACLHKPGWYQPGEAEKTADLLGLTLPDLFDDYLAVDWIETPDGPVFVLSPAVVGAPTGDEFPANPTGRCVFLTDDDRCKIHGAKPFECANYWCDFTPTPRMDHYNVGTTWNDYQQQIHDLLGREPTASPWSAFGGLTW